jgi:hypothetical protein
MGDNNNNKMEEEVEYQPNNRRQIIILVIKKKTNEIFIKPTGDTRKKLSNKNVHVRWRLLHVLVYKYTKTTIFGGWVGFFFLCPAVIVDQRLDKNVGRRSVRESSADAYYYKHRQKEIEIHTNATDT